MAENIANEINWEARAIKAEAAIVNLKNSLKEEEPKKQEEVKQEEVIKEEPTIDELVEKRYQEYLAEKENAGILNNQAQTNWASISEEPVISNTFNKLEPDEYLKLSTEDKNKYNKESISKFWDIIFE